MKKIKYLMVSLILVAGATAHAASLYQYPESQDFKKFSEEVSEFLKLSIEREINPVSERNDLIRRRILEDQNNWEAALAPIIGNPDKYGQKVSTIALIVAYNRGKLSQHPDLAEAAVRLFHYEKDRALKRLDEDRVSGSERGAGRVILGGFIAKSLGYKLPQILQEVLIYFNSEAETKLNLIEAYTPNEVAESLRNYGDERHIGEARKFSIKLRSAGKSDIADDIDRSVERIEKDQARSAAGAERKGADRDAGKAGEEDAKAEANSASRSWIVAGLVTLVALGAGALFLKRKG